MSSPPTEAGVGLGRRAARLGARQAAVQALGVALAFLVAGSLTRFAMDRVDDAAVRERVAGEALSLGEEWRQRGIGHLPHTLQKRVRLWRGFAYGLAAPGGAAAQGMLDPAAAPGWSERSGRPDDPDLRRRPYLVETVRLPDGALLAVGQDLSARARESAALTWTLLVCGLIGAGVSVVASAVFARADWRRVVALAQTAREVSEGRLATRAAERGGPPRDDLDDLARAFNAMLDQTEGLLAQVRRVSAGVAHDLRTPLTRVMQRLERLHARTAADAPASAEVERLQADIGEILRTFEALLQLAELEQAVIAPPAPWVDISEVAARVGEAFRPDIEDGGRSLTLDCAPAPVRADGQLLAQALANLLENAIRHTPPGSAIGVRVRPGPTPRLVVVDDGPGVPSARRGDVLRPMVRLEASRSTPGSGLGLALVAAVAARHGARLTLDDARPGLEVTLAFAG